MSYMGCQIDLLLWLQHLRTLSGGCFDVFFSSITYFGQILIPLMISALIFWCIDKKSGAFIILNGAFAVMVNQLLKNIACIYRPWVLDSRIKPVQGALYASSGYSFPSGHTSIATSCWGAIAKIWSKNKILVVLMALLILAVAFSRNYLGVHTPQDVIVSMIVGIGLLYLTNKVLKWIENGKNRDLIIFGAMSIFCILLIIYTELKQYPIDYLNGQILVDPVKMRFESYPKAGFALG